MVISGTNDFLFCNGYVTSIPTHSLIIAKYVAPRPDYKSDPPVDSYCEGDIESSAQAVFTASKNLKTYLQPATGHGMNFHHNATGYYKIVTDFLGENGF
jgi:hypothetical protein